MNTKNYKIGDQPINNANCFTSFSGDTKIIYTSNPTNYLIEKDQFGIGKKPANYYAINIDWFQFICLTEKNGNVLELCSSARIKISKNQTHHNPNFKYEYKVDMDNCEICEIHAVPINCKHTKNEISVKVSNSQLYTKDWSVRIRVLLDELGFIFSKLTKIDIALDGNDIISKMDLFRRYLRTKTVLINTSNLKIEGVNFNKQELKWDTYTIGCKNYQKSAEIYHKSNEIKESGKHYLPEHWKENGLDITNGVGRFELKIGSRHLRKYKINSFDDFCDAAYLGKILFDEVNNWLRFYQVNLYDIKNRRKDTAIKNGKEIKFIHWDRVPQITIHLEKVIHVPDHRAEAKKAVTRAIGEILKGYTVDSTDTLINFVEATTTEYNIYDHTFAKINDAVKINPTGSNSLSILQNLLETKVAFNNGIGDAGIIQTE